MKCLFPLKDKNIMNSKSINDQKISIVIPAYNEEKGIGPVLDDLCKILTGAPFEYEIIVVDDGSIDQTAALARQKPCVQVYQHKVNKGYGASLKTGILHAKYDVICITDADGTYPNGRIPDLVARLFDGFDMVVGARTGMEVAIPWVRRPAKWAIGRLANLIAGENIPDINSGLRIFRRKTAAHFMQLLPDGFSFTTTITLGMLANGYTVAYEPINYYARQGRSKIKPIKDTLNFVQLILKIGLYFAPLKIFLPLSGFLFCLAILWGLFTRFVLERLADVSTMVIVMAAIQVAAIGLLAELINHRLSSNYKENEEEK
jgi:glycosyltransferase involved in cell wall biosynthesis